MIKNVIPKHLEAITAKLDGDRLQKWKSLTTAVRVKADKAPAGYAHVKTHAISRISDRYAAADRCTLLALSEGTSIVTETIFENKT